MSAPISTISDLAAEAEFQLISAADQLCWLTALANAIQLDHAHGSGKYAAHLAQLASHLDDTGFSGVYSAIDEFKQLSESAPQNADLPNRGADKPFSQLTLAEFAKGRQISAADQLGITQQALNTALKLKREIVVTVNPDGVASGVETKPFPSATRRKRR